MRKLINICKISSKLTYIYVVVVDLASENGYEYDVLLMREDDIHVCLCLSVCLNKA